ncbi:hypothetical protein GGI20_001423 [Coemansia sp. BCRC 34301]|nr:hypothetical protein GGI20_001423 [Coemansia sp. BCRC 34301]
MGKDDSVNSKPRGIRARLRQRRVWNSSEDEVRSRPTSLDLGRNNAITPAMLGSAATHSLTTVPTRTSAHYQDDDDDDGPAGLALGEFGEHCDDVAEVAEEDDDAYPQAAGTRPSGAIVRSPDLHAAAAAAALSDGTQSSRHRGSVTSKRRVSVQSVPVYHPAAADQNMSEDYGAHTDEEHSSIVNSGNYSYDYSYDDEGGEAGGSINEGPGPHGDEFDGDGELNAVYLKRNADFHMLFRNIPINELLIDDYGCALQRDILVQGRLYLTENFVSFYSNIFGWVTNLIIAFDEIVSIEKKMTALIIPNAIQVSTLHAKHFFGSFIYRDSAYNQLYDLWGKSRNEKNAGQPEIGQAEDGDGAGDVSRHREDVLNAYQSLSEGEEEEDDAGSEFEEEGSVEASSESGSVSDAESAAVSATAVKGADDAALDSNGALAHDGLTPAAGHGAGNLKAPTGLRGTAAIMTTNGSSGGGTSASNTPADLSRAHSELSAMTTKVPGTEANGTPAIAGSAASLAATGMAAVVSGPPPLKSAGRPGASSLLARIPKTPDGTDAGSQASSAAVGRSKKHQANGSVSVGYPPPPLHKPTTCPCGSSGKPAHYSMEALDAVFPLPMPLLFRIVFSASVPSDVERLYMPADVVSRGELEQSCTKRIKECGNLDVKTEGWVPDPSDNGLEMCIYSYEKLLGFSIGPKSTIVEDTFRITTKDFDKVVVVDQVVRTPSIPSGTAFFVKIRHCLSWASGPGNQPPGGWSHYRMTFELEWVKSSWIKGAIEKGSVDSNKQAAELSEKYIREWVAAHPSLEVKPQSAMGLGALPPTAIVAHKRSRKPLARKSKRDASPHGLRMEELLGADTSERSTQPMEEIERRAERGGSGGLPHVSSAATADAVVSASGAFMDARADAAAGSDAARDLEEARAWRRSAETSWPGWIGYHSVYPVQRTARRSARAVHAAMADSVAGPALALALVVLLMWSNAWRAGYNIPANADGMRQMRESIDALAEQMAAANQKLQELLEKQT